VKRWISVIMLTGILLISPVHAMPDDTTNTLLQSMTLEQKVAQMFMVGLYGPNLTVEGQKFLETYQPGAVVVFRYNTGNAVSVTQLINDWQTVITDAGAPPLLIAVDQEGGRINTLEGEPFTHFPVPALVTAAGNHNLAYRTGAAQSLELRAVGIHMNLAPVADLETNPDNPVIFRRAYGSDPRIVAPTISAVVQGMQDNGVVATLKHFPGHGDTAEDSHIELPVLPYNQDALAELELIPFEAGIGAGAEAVMVGHLWLPELEPTPYLPASLSPNIVTGLLREEMAFDGIIMTDALDMDAIDTAYTIPTASVMAVQAGIDLIAFGPHAGVLTQEAAIDEVIEAVRDGRISEGQINASVYRILNLKRRYGVLDWQPLDTTTVEARVSAADGSAIVDELFTAGVTLVFDQTTSLPLQANTATALIYPNHRRDVMRACVQQNPNLRLLEYSDFPTINQVTEAARIAGEVQHLVIFTENAINNRAQTDLVNALPPEKTVVVAYWSPYDVNGFDRLPTAYITTYSPHPSGIVAACGVLFGALPARGRLPMTLSEQILAASGAGYPAR
jgi:beta-N-acetylhexosaminidase